MMTAEQKDELIEALIDTYKERFGIDKTIMLLYDIGLREEEMYALGLPAESVDRVLNIDTDLISIGNGTWVTMDEWKEMSRDDECSRYTE